MFARLQFARFKRPLGAVLALILLAFAVVYGGPMAAASLSSGMQTQRRGILRGRIQERLEQRKEEARETKERNERPPTETRQLGGLEVAIWQPAERGRVAMLMFSHGFHGCNTQSTYLMQQFADNGYIVVAPNHKDAGCGGARGGGGLRGARRPDEPTFREYEKWNDTTYRDRADDFRRLTEALRKDRQLNSRIDWDHVGLVGHSLGGYTVLGLAGGWPSWRLPNIKAVLAWSPVCEPFAMRDTLKGIRIPVMYQGGTRDLGITPSVRKNNGCFARNAKPAIFVEFNGAGHFAWTDLKDTAQDLIDDYSLDFVDTYVRGVANATFSASSRVAGVADLRVK